MSIHPSLRGANNLSGERSVLTRFERIQKLVKDGKVDPEEDSAYGLPKVRTKFKVLSAKQRKAAAAASSGGEKKEAAESGEATAG
jgi:small basic protein (TIGR04137 family)